MANFIDIEKSNLFSVIRKLDNLLKDNYVINLVKLNSYKVNKLGIERFQDNQSIPPEVSQLKAQFKKTYNYEEYQIITYDSFSKKTNISKYKSKNDFKKAVVRYMSGKLYPLKLNRFGKIKTKIEDENYYEVTNFDNILSYHKQKISKKSTKQKFVSDERDLKKEVYRWLLKKNKNAVIIPEYSINDRRADYVSFDTKKIDCTVIEIKSELDTLDRLEPQLKTYSTIANNIYIALDVTQYTKLISSGINISKSTGILIFDNSQSKKLYELKKATKLRQVDYPFISYLSYLDINNSFTGFKCSSKLSKEQKEIFMHKYINKRTINRFAYDVLCNRYIKESDKRKELLQLGDIEKSVASSKELNINRFDLTGKHQITLFDYIDDKEILYRYFIKQENILLNEFRNIPNFKNYIKSGSGSLDALVTHLKNQKDSHYTDGLVHTFSFYKKSNAKIDNQLCFLQSLVKNKDEVMNFIINKLNKSGAVNG